MINIIASFSCPSLNISCWFEIKAAFFSQIERALVAIATHWWGLQVAHSQKKKKSPPPFSLYTEKVQWARRLCGIFITSKPVVYRKVTLPSVRRKQIRKCILCFYIFLIYGTVHFLIFLKFPSSLPFTPFHLLLSPFLPPSCPS